MGHQNSAFPIWQEQSSYKGVRLRDKRRNKRRRRCTGCSLNIYPFLCFLTAQAGVSTWGPEIEFEVKLMRIKPTEERRGTQRPGQESRASGANWTKSQWTCSLLGRLSNSVGLKGLALRWLGSTLDSEITGPYPRSTPFVPVLGKGVFRPVMAPCDRKTLREPTLLSCLFLKGIWTVPLVSTLVSIWWRYSQFPTSSQPNLNLQQWLPSPDQARNPHCL